MFIFFILAAAAGIFGTGFVCVKCGPEPNKKFIEWRNANVKPGEKIQHYHIWLDTNYTSEHILSDTAFVYINTSHGWEDGGWLTGHRCHFPASKQKDVEALIKARKIRSRPWVLESHRGMF